MPDSIVATWTPPGPALEQLRAAGDLWVWPHDREIDSDILRRRIVDADGLLCALTDRIDADLIDVAAKLRVISSAAVEVDNIDLEACRRRGISVRYTPDVLTESIADMAWALLLASSRRLVEGVDQVRSGPWERRNATSLAGSDVSGSTLGIVGMGDIGRAVAERSAGFGMSVSYASNPHEGQVEERDRARPVGFVDVLAGSDHVVVCVPRTEGTNHLIDAEALRVMKPTASLVSVSPSGAVDLDALVEALASGQIRCAGLAFTDQDPLPAGHALVTLPNCTIVPDTAMATDRTLLRMAQLAVGNLFAGLAGEPMSTKVV